MIYYKIETSTDLKEIGAYPQAQNFIEPDGELLPTEKQPRIWNLNFLDKLPDNTYCNIHALTKKSKLTDLVSYVAESSFGLLMSDKLRVILEPYLNDNAQFIANPVFFNNTVLKNYWLLHFYKFSFEKLDFSKTEVWKMLSTWDKDQKLPVRNEKDFLGEVEKYQYPHGHGVKIENISFLAETKDDFFALRHISGGIGYFVSNNLKLKIQGEGCTGIRFLGLNERV